MKNSIESIFSLEKTSPLFLIWNYEKAWLGNIGIQKHSIVHVLLAEILINMSNQRQCYNINDKYGIYQRKIIKNLPKHFILTSD